MGAPKIQAIFFLEHQWIPLNGWKRDIQNCLDNVAYIQMAFKMCRKIIGKKAKRNDRYSWKQNWAREKHLKKQIPQSLQGLRNVH